jgi:hypothetical protein
MLRVLIFHFIFCHCLFDFFFVQRNYPQNDQESSMFIEWNSKTIESLDNQLKIAIGDTQYARRIAIRIDAFKSYLNIKGANELNKESIRFKFLSTLRQESLLPSDFYLFEIRSGGERVIIKNLLLEKSGCDSVKIAEFEYVKEEWQKIAERREGRWKLQSPLSLERVSFGKGKNPDDLIITRFRKFKILESEYFVYGTFLKYDMVRNTVE